MDQIHKFETALLSFPKPVQAELRSTLLEDTVIPSATVASWLAIMNIEIGELMIQLLPVAEAYARAPISNFHVGVVVLGMPPSSPVMGPGNLYFGSNMEFPGEAISFCVHGEQSATSNAWIHGETGLQAMAINAAPCGYCRQFLYELTTATKGFNILLKAKKDPNDHSYTSKPLTYYIPDAFGPSDLKSQGGLMETEAHGLIFASNDPTIIDPATIDPATIAALHGANACYSPYTFDYSAVSIVDKQGKIFTGRYAENAAYNPSMSPLESALAYLNMNSVVQKSMDISRAILVEAPSKISQRSATEAVLSSVAPTVSLEYVRASKSK